VSFSVLVVDFGCLKGEGVSSISHKGGGLAVCAVGWTLEQISLSKRGGRGSRRPLPTVVKIGDRQSQRTKNPTGWDLTKGGKGSLPEHSVSGKCRDQPRSWYDKKRKVISVAKVV